MQITSELIWELKQNSLELGIETNGTQPLPDGLDWITVSPKAGTELATTSGNELKLVWPQENISLLKYEKLNFDHFYLQPKDCTNQLESTRLAVEACLANPTWKLSLQTHKFIGIP